MDGLPPIGSAVILRHLIPLYDPTVKEWALEARLLRWLTFLWLFVGLAVLFSASYPIADATLDDGLHYFKSQLMWVAIGMVGFNLLVHSPIRYILGLADWIVLALLLLIFITLLPGAGVMVNGANRWLPLGPFLLQPSELIKPFLVLQSARIFGYWDRLSWTIRISWLSIFLVVLAAVLLQPNLSTAALCGMVIWLVAMASGLPFTYLGGSALSGIVLALISISRNSYQFRRITSFVNPWADPLGDGYQLIQSLLAVGSGGLWGTGFGLSQQKLFYLPIQYTDFIFAVFAEEFGWIGSLLLLLLLLSYATVGLWVALKASNTVHRLVAIGIVVLMVGQSLINIGVAIGALPTTGLPFPLFSYGGNSMLASLLSAGILIRIARESGGAKVIAIPSPQARRPA